MWLTLHIHVLACPAKHFIFSIYPPTRPAKLFLTKKTINNLQLTLALRSSFEARFLIFRVLPMMSQS